AVAQPAAKAMAAQSGLSGSNASAPGSQLKRNTTPFARPWIALGANWSLGFTNRTALLLYAPTRIGNIAWAIGPAVILPVAAGASGNPWGAGTSALASRIEGPWSYGAFISNVWSFAGAAGSDGGMTVLTLQPFVRYIPVKAGMRHPRRQSRRI